MGDTNPFVIKIPEGTSEVDLSPILRPLIHALRNEIRGHEARAHRFRDMADELSPNNIADWLTDAADELRYQELIRKVTRGALVACMKDMDWVPTDKRDWEYVRSYYFNGASWDYRGDRVHLRSPDRFNASVADEVIRQITPYQGSKLEMVEKVLSYVNVLDRIVQEISDE